MTVVSLGHLRSHRTLVPVFLLQPAQTDSKTGWGRVERWGRGPVGMQLCVHCFIKINHLDKDISSRIYIEQLQKQASVCEALMQPDHTASLNHRAGLRDGGGWGVGGGWGSHKDSPLNI